VWRPSLKHHFRRRLVIYAAFSSGIGRAVTLLLRFRVREPDPRPRHRSPPFGKRRDYAPVGSGSIKAAAFVTSTSVCWRTDEADLFAGISRQSREAALHCQHTTSELRPNSPGANGFPRLLIVRLSCRAVRLLILFLSL
jgi:hypothetical protein